MYEWDGQAEVASAGMYEERGCSVVVLVRWGQDGGVYEVSLRTVVV